MTRDIDTIIAIENPRVLNQIEIIGRKYGLLHWLNDQAENLIMPRAGRFDKIKSGGLFLSW